MTINNTIKTELNKRLLNKIFNLNMGAIYFSIFLIKVLKTILYMLTKKFKTMKHYLLIALIKA